MHFRSLSGLFGNWLKCHRKDVLDISQLEFADAVSCSVSTIQSYEQNRYQPSKEMAERIAHFLEYPDTHRFVVFARQKQAKKDMSGFLQSSAESDYEAVIEASTYMRVVGMPHTSVEALSATLEEAEAHYWKQWEPLLLHQFFGELVASPTTINGWTELAEITNGVQKVREAAKAQIQIVLERRSP